MKTLNLLFSDFNEMWKICVLKEYPGISNGPKFLTKYRVEPFSVLGRVLQSELERLLELLGRDDIYADYAEVKKPKIDRALANLDNYKIYNTKGGSSAERARARKWQARPYSFEISLRLADFAYEVAGKVLNDECLEGVREEMTVHYWFVRYLNNFYGVTPVDVLNPEKELRNAVLNLKAKLQSGKYSWIYAQYLNTMMSLGMVNKDSKDYKKLYSEGLTILRPTLPASGTIKVKTADGINNVLIESTIREFGISLGKKFFKNGIKGVPILETPHSINNAY